MLASKHVDWSGLHFAVGLGYLALLAALGLLLAYDREHGLVFRDPPGALIAHVHLALVGWVSLSILGASYRLVPFLAQARLSSRWPGRLAFTLANLGVLGLAADGLFLGHHHIAGWGVILAAAYACYAVQAWPLLKGEAHLHPSLGFTVLAFIGGAAWVALGLGLAFGAIVDEPETRAAYVFCALLGWVTPFILGQIHKIAPFLVWLHVYSPRHWTPPVAVPKIEDLTSLRLAWLELALLAPAVALGVTGFLRESAGLLGASSWLLLGCATTYVVNTALTARHLIRRDPRWS